MGSSCKKTHKIIATEAIVHWKLAKTVYVVVRDWWAVIHNTYIKSFLLKGNTSFGDQFFLSTPLHLLIFLWNTWLQRELFLLVFLFK